MKNQTLVSKLHKPVHPVFTLVIILIGIVGIGSIIMLVLQSSRKPISTPQQYQAQLTPTPTSEPMIFSPSGTENWKVYISPDHTFGLRYPQDMQIDVNKGYNNIVSFHKGAFKDNSEDFEFHINTGSEDIFNKTYVLGNDGHLLSDLFNNPNGVLRDNLANGSNFQKERIIVTKLASLTINGYPAVNFTDVYTGGTQQPPDYANRYIIKTPKGYYLISQGFVSSQTKLDQYANELKLIVSTFTIL